MVLAWQKEVGRGRRSREPQRRRHRPRATPPVPRATASSPRRFTSWSAPRASTGSSPCAAEGVSGPERPSNACSRLPEAPLGRFGKPLRGHGPARPDGRAGLVLAVRRPARRPRVRLGALLDQDGRLGDLERHAGAAAAAALRRSSSFTVPMPSTTSPKMVCLPSRCGVGTKVMKNCEPSVPGPALAIAQQARLVVAHVAGRTRRRTGSRGRRCRGRAGPRPGP